MLSLDVPGGGRAYLGTPVLTLRSARDNIRIVYVISGLPGVGRAYLGTPLSTLRSAYCPSH